METANILTYSDIVKLTIPFVFSLILIWFRSFYIKNEERKYKNYHLWRGLTNSERECLKFIDALDTTLEKLEKDTIVFFAFDCPRTLTNYAERLAELEKRNSYLYSEYCSNVEIVRNGHKSLQYLLTQTTFQQVSNDKIEERIKKAIRSQINALKGDILLKTDAEINLLEMIQKKNKKYDMQLLNSFKVIYKEAERKLDKKSFSISK